MLLQPFLMDELILSLVFKVEHVKIFVRLSWQLQGCFSRERSLDDTRELFHAFFLFQELAEWLQWFVLSQDLNNETHQHVLMSVNLFFRHYVVDNQVRRILRQLGLVKLKAVLNRVSKRQIEMHLFRLGLVVILDFISNFK